MVPHHGCCWKMPTDWWSCPTPSFGMRSDSGTFGLARLRMPDSCMAVARATMMPFSGIRICRPAAMTALPLLTGPGPNCTPLAGVDTLGLHLLGALRRGQCRLAGRWRSAAGEQHEDQQQHGQRERRQHRRRGVHLASVRPQRAGDRHPLHRFQPPGRLVRRPRTGRADRCRHRRSRRRRRRRGLAR